MVPVAPAVRAACAVARGGGGRAARASAAAVHDARRPLSSLLMSSAPPQRMPIFWSERYHVDLPAGHRFPMERYRVVHRLLLQVAAAAPVELRAARAASLEDVLRAHDADYVRDYVAGRLPADAHRLIGFPWTPEFVERTLTITGGTLQATHAALGAFRARAPDGAWVGPGGVAANLAGGTHHAFRAHGEGYCIFNDLSVAARWAQQQQPQLWGALPPPPHAPLQPQPPAPPPPPPPRVLVLDLDVHQGNGTAEIHAGDAAVFTFSMQCGRNYPWSSRVASDLDVDVPDGAGDDEYLALLRSSLAALELALGAGGALQPPVAGGGGGGGVRVAGPAPWLGGVQLVLFQAGVDPLRHDRLGRLRLTRSGLRERNELVFRWCEERGLPVVVTMGGGYSRPIELSARCHVDVMLQAGQSWARRARAWAERSAERSMRSAL